MSVHDTSTSDEVSESVLVPLALLKLNHGEPIRGVTRFQKLVFLAQHGGLEDDPINEQGIGLYFEYGAEKYGPFSEGLSKMLDTLADEGNIERQEMSDDTDSVLEFTLTDEGRQLLGRSGGRLDRETFRTLKLTKTLYNRMPLFELLDKVYAAYPEYTTKR